MYFLSEKQFLLQNIVYEQVSILWTNCHTMTFRFQGQVGQSVPLPYCAGLDLEKHCKVIFGISETNYLVIRTTYVYLS